MHRTWSGRRGSNSRHFAWKANALPTELRPHDLYHIETHCRKPTHRFERLSARSSQTTDLRFLALRLAVHFNMVRDIATTLPYVPVLLKNQFSSLDMAPTCVGAHIVRPAGK